MWRAGCELRGGLPVHRGRSAGLELRPNAQQQAAGRGSAASHRHEAGASATQAWRGAARAPARRLNRALATHRRRSGTTGSQSLRLASEQAAMAVSEWSCGRTGANGRWLARTTPGRPEVQRSPHAPLKGEGLGRLRAGCAGRRSAAQRRDFWAADESAGCAGRSRAPPLEADVMRLRGRVFLGWEWGLLGAWQQESCVVDLGLTLVCAPTWSRRPSRARGSGASPL